MNPRNSQGLSTYSGSTTFLPRPPSYICTTHADPRPMDADGIHDNLIETQQQFLRVIITLVEHLNQPPRPIVSAKGAQTPTRRTADAASQTRMTHAAKAKHRLSINDGS